MNQEEINKNLQDKAYNLILTLLLKSITSANSEVYQAYTRDPEKFFVGHAHSIYDCLEDMAYLTGNVRYFANYRNSDIIANYIEQQITDALTYSLDEYTKLLFNNKYPQSAIDTLYEEIHYQADILETAIEDSDYEYNKLANIIQKQYHYDNTQPGAFTKLDFIVKYGSSGLEVLDSIRYELHMQYCEAIENEMFEKLHDKYDRIFGAQVEQLKNGNEVEEVR